MHIYKQIDSNIPLIWDYMKPWNILRHYKSVFKKISIIRTNAHHQSVKYKFEVNNTFMKGYILCIIIPTKKDFQCVFLLYHNSYKNTLQAVLTRSKVVYADGTQQCWKSKLPNIITLSKAHQPIGMFMFYHSIIIHTQESGICIPFHFTRDAQTDECALHFDMVTAV